MTKRKKIVMAVLIVILVIVLALVGIFAYGRRQMGKIPAMSFEDVLAYTTKGKQDAVITVGIVRDGTVSYTVYGEDGKELPPALHTYEIGSITKTMTAALISKAVLEGKIDISESIDRYLPLPADKAYPTVAALLTHTSGYNGYYFETPMISNFFRGRNSFYGISRDAALKRVSEVAIKDETHAFRYANFGYAVLGLVLEAVYETDYTSLANHFLQDELGLFDTRISDGSGDLSNYWAWKADDAYISVGAVTSNIADMLVYTQLQLAGMDGLGQTQQSLKKINATTDMYRMMDVHLDEIGMAWIRDNENKVIWHNGGTGDYNSYIGFSPETGIGVVVLSNLGPSVRIPATVLGAKLMIEMQEGRN